MKRKSTCETNGCGCEAQIAGLCKRCYQRLWYWTKKSPAQIVQRKRNLDMWSATVEQLQPTVKTIKRKRSA